MAKIIGFREDFKCESVIFGEGQCYGIRNLRGLTKEYSSSEHGERDSPSVGR